MLNQDGDCGEAYTYISMLPLIPGRLANIMALASGGKLLAEIS